MLILCLYPVWYVLIQSLSEGNRAVKALLLPVNFTFSNYEQMLSRSEIVHAFLISVSRTVIGTALTLLCCMFLGYLFSKEDMPRVEKEISAFIERCEPRLHRVEVRFSPDSDAPLQMVFSLNAELRYAGDDVFPVHLVTRVDPLGKVTVSQ